MRERPSTEIPITEAEKAAEIVAVNGWSTPPELCACTIKSGATSWVRYWLRYTGLYPRRYRHGRAGCSSPIFPRSTTLITSFHGDTNYRSQVTFKSYEREGDIIRLRYDGDITGGGGRVLTLREKDGGYLFVSNLMTAESGAPSPADAPAPDAVRAAAHRYIQGQLVYWNQTSSSFSTVDGTPQVATWDTWRIDGLTFARSFTELDGKPVQHYWQSGYNAAFDALDIYQLSYRLHTATPDKVGLAGGMNMDEDGWVWFNSPYLIFSNNSGSPVFLFTLIDEVRPDAEVFPRDLLRRLTALKEARADALSHLDALFADGESTLWYVAEGGSPDGPIPADLSYVRDARYEARYEALFSCTWEPQSYCPEPSGPCLVLGDGPDRCFRFYLGSDLVYWHDGDTVTSWFADEAFGTAVSAAASAALPDAMMFDFSGYEIDIGTVSVPEKSGESAEDTLRRFLDAYGAHLKSVTPENAYRITDFKLLEFGVIQAQDNRIRLWIRNAVKPPEALYTTTPWWAGNSLDGEGDLAGWLVMSREMVLELSDGVWRCTGFGTGG